jgi:hypothetical protein
VGITLDDLEIALGLGAWLAAELAVSLALLELAADLGAGLATELAVGVTLGKVDAMWMLVSVL